MHPHELTLVVQGPWRKGSRALLRRLRQDLPEATIVWATAVQASPADPASDEWAMLVDRLVGVNDPGMLQPTVRSSTAPPNNLNRQLASTRAGLREVHTPYCCKLRSDADIDMPALMRQWREQATRDGHEDRLAFAHLYTRHPEGINGYPFHVSDWICLGRSAQVERYWSAPGFPAHYADWFARHPHAPGTTATGARFLARYTQEQWICLHHARRLGYQTPEHLNDRRPAVLQDYRRYLARECMIVDAMSIGLRVPGHDKALTSWFQHLDCVSTEDWRRLRDSDGRTSDNLLRRTARGLRHPIARGVLLRRWLSQRTGP